MNDLLTIEELNNPRAWFYKAQMYRSLVLLVSDDFKVKCVDGAKIDEVVIIYDALNTVPYLTCLSLEIYMKGYLISKGLTGDDAAKYKHKVWLLRKECLRQSKNEHVFGNPDLKYLTDALGPALMSDGGVRYPSNKQTVIPYESCIISLNLVHNELRKIVRRWPRILSL